jgi:hypothetical protein
MTEAEARKILEPFLLEGVMLDSDASMRLWRAGYVEAEDVTDHDTRPIGRKKYMATKLTAKGRRLMSYLKERKKVTSEAEALR